MTLLWLLRKGGGQGETKGHSKDKLASVCWAVKGSGWWETEMYMPWKKKLLGAHYLVMSSAGFVWTGTWRLNWVDGISILQNVATSSVVSASALSLEILKIAQFVWKKLTAISTTEFIYNVCFVAQDRQTPWLDFSTSLCRNYGVVGIQCSELRKSDFKHCSLECMKTFIAHKWRDCFFIPLASCCRPGLLLL